MFEIKERLDFGKKTEEFKVRTNEYCHSTFVDFCRSIGIPKPAVALRELAIITCLIFKHKRFNEVRSRILQSKLNQQGVVDEIIDSYLDSEKNNVIRLDQRKDN